MRCNQIESPYLEAVDVLIHNVFGIAFSSLPDAEYSAVRRDVIDLSEEFDGSITDAAIELRRRIGGASVLAYYAQCIVR